jgi:hypothetical protein
MESQTVDSVIQMLKGLGRQFDPLPEFVKLADGAQLTKSSKGDCYYHTSPEGCTCPGFYYHHSCKHMKALASTSAKLRGQTIAETLEEHDKNLHKMPASYRCMVRLAREEAEAEGDSDSLIKRGGFKPVCPDDEPSETNPKTKQALGGLRMALIDHRTAIIEDIAEIELALVILNGLKNVNMARLALLKEAEARGEWKSSTSNEEA